MEALDVGSIRAGDRLAWIIPKFKLEQSATVKKVLGYGFSKTYNVPYVDIITGDQHQRSVGLAFIIRRNGRRTDRTNWDKVNPDLRLFEQELPEKKHLRIAQIRIPLDEEDELANSLKTTTRKGLDEMSQSHRDHIEKWEPHIDALGAEHVWASANRFAGRGGEGPVFVAIKRGSKNYAIVEYNTETKKKAKVVADGFESSKTLMEAFKDYREQAKGERAESRPTKTKKAAPAKSVMKKATKKAVKKPVKKIVRK